MWTAGKANVRLFDLFGNPVEPTAQSLSFEPYYLTGTPAEVKSALLKSGFRANAPVELTARKMGNRLWVEAHNNTGSTGTVEAPVAGKNVEFDFRLDPKYNTVELPGNLAVNFDGRFARDAAFLGKLPLEVKLNDGTPVRLEIQGSDLIVSATVKDANLMPPPGEGLYAGSSLEVFLDNAPFRELKRDFGGAQYVFSALPSKTTGKTVQRVKSELTGATATVTKINGGYSLTAKIPLSELNLRSLAGISLELNRAGAAEKAKLVPGKEKSYCERFHYPIIETATENELPNPNFDAVKFNAPETWNYSFPGAAELHCGPELGIEGNGLEFRLPVPAAVPTMLDHTIKVQPGKYTKGIFSGWVKLDQITSDHPRHGDGGFRLAVNFKRSGVSLGRDRKTDIVGSTDWKLVQWIFDIPANTDYVRFTSGLNPGATGNVRFDNLKLQLLP